MEALTKRQVQVTRRVALGMTNAEIAVDLKIGQESVKTHLLNACRKLKARNRAELVHLAHEAGYFRDGGAARVQSRDAAGSRTL